LLKAAGRDLIEVVVKMLQWDPEMRIGVEDVLKLRFFEENNQKSIGSNYAINDTIL
jgi:hypothetical protein